MVRTDLLETYTVKDMLPVNFHSPCESSFSIIYLKVFRLLGSFFIQNLFGSVLHIEDLSEVKFPFKTS